MGSRVIVCGSVTLSVVGAYATAQEIPLLEMSVADPEDASGISFVPAPMRAADIFSADGDDDEYRAWSKNTFDPVRERWLFGCSLHDDDWFNATHDLLPNCLANLKDRPGIDLIVAYTEWSRTARDWVDDRQG